MNSMDQDTLPDQTLSDAEIRRIGWKGMMVLGAIMLIGGVLAFLNPFAASLAVEALVGSVFLVVGAMQLWMAFSAKDEETGQRWLTGMLGLALVLFFVMLLVNPIAGLVTLTFAAAVLFAAMGGLRVAYAWRRRPAAGWGWIFAAGLLSFALALMIALSLPESALGLLGLFLGIDLTMTGFATMALAWQLKRDESTE